MVASSRFQTSLGQSLACLFFSAQFLKCMILEMHVQVQLEWVQAQSKQEVIRIVFVSTVPIKKGMDTSPMNYLSTDDAVDVILGDSSYVGCAYAHDELFAMTCEVQHDEARAHSTTKLCSNPFEVVLPMVNYLFLFSHTRGVGKVPNQDKKKIVDAVKEIPSISMISNEFYNQGTPVFIEEMPTLATMDDESIEDEDVEEEAIASEDIDDEIMHDESSEDTDFDDAFEQEHLNNKVAQGQDNLNQDFEVRMNLDEAMHAIDVEEQVPWMSYEDFPLLEVEDKEDDFLLVAIPIPKYRPLEDLIKERCICRFF